MSYTVARKALADRQPIISIDCKKKELVGDFKNAGREWRPKGEPELVRVHVGIDHDTAQFAVNSTMRRNCRSRSGCWRPSLVFALACRL